jgi:hypothetical protein
MSFKARIVESTPMICLIIYLTIGFTLNIWHPTWIIFSLIFIMPVLVYSRFRSIIYILLLIAIYIPCGIIFGIWHPLWIIFLTIPVYLTLVAPYIQKVIIKNNKEEIKESI